MTNKKEPSGFFFGITTIDCIYLVDTPPGRNEKITADRQLTCSGGPGSNAAIAFSALGGRAVLLSCVGKHPLAAITHHELTTHGIDHIDLCPEYPSVPTVSSIYVSKNNGDRSVVSIYAKHIHPQNPSVEALSLAGYQTALFDGQHMELAILLAKACRKAGIHTILDGGSWKPGTEKLIHFIDTAICSSKFNPPGSTTFDETLKWLCDQKVKRAAITRGEKSILAAEKGNRFDVRPPQLRPIKDTLAAGDIFHGAYAYFHTKAPGEGFGDLLKKSAQIASTSCLYFGPRKWINDL